MALEDISALHFFLSANTPQGFVSRFDYLADPYKKEKLYVIKGGPGSGKSSFMKGIAAALLAKGEAVELIHCSSDPTSLDGIICRGRGIAVCDGTPPHAIEPKYPGVFESVVNLYDLLDEEQLTAHSSEIIELFTLNKNLHERATRFLSAAGSLLGDSYRLTLEHTDIGKIAKYATRLSLKEFRPKTGRKGAESVRFLSAVTVGGDMMFTESAKRLAKRLYIIDDEHGAVARLLLLALRGEALDAGYDIITCYCPMSPYDKIEHLFIPELGVGFMTSNKFHKLDLEAFRTIHTQRFTDKEKLAEKKQRLNFNRKAAKELLGEASKLITDAKGIHDQLEKYYVDAMDFNALSQRSEAVIRKILQA